MVAVATRTSSRTDALPEFHIYRDTGCDYHPSCLTCPFAECRYDRPIVDQEREGTHARIVELRKAGKRCNAIATAVGLSKRTVMRVLAQAKTRAS